MNKPKKEKDIIEPIWYLERFSIFQKRSQRLIWIMLIPLLGPFFLLLLLTFIPSNILVININSTNLLIIYVVLLIILYFLTRKYIVERGLKVDKYFWVEYYLGKIGLELYRLGKLKDYPHLVDIYNTSLRNWLLVVALDYHGDTSGKKAMIYDLRKRLKSLSFYVNKTKYNSDRMFELGKKFTDLGEDISKKNLVRIDSNKLQQLINCFEGGKPGILSYAQKILTPEMTIVGFILFVGFAAGIASFYFGNFNLFESIQTTIMITSVLLAIYTVKRK